MNTGKMDTSMGNSLNDNFDSRSSNQSIYGGWSSDMPSYPGIPQETPQGFAAYPEPAIQADTYSNTTINHTSIAGVKNYDTMFTEDTSMLFTSKETAPEMLTNSVYTAGFLHSLAGRLVKVEFLMGNQLCEKTGRLVKVGASYIVLQTIESDSYVMCDIYSIKFVTLVGNQ